jgi:hypothetical protein
MSKKQSNDINFVISTVDRPKKYIHKLLSELRCDHPVRLIVGSPHYTYLEQYANNPLIEIVGVDSAEWKEIKNSSVIHRALWNYWRCLVYGGKTGQRGLVVLEDDVIPAIGWETRLYDTIDQIEEQYGGEYVLALFTYFTKLGTPVAKDIYYNRYPAYAFGGTPAMYYPESIRLAFAEYLKKEGVDSFRLAYDWLLREYMMATGIPCFATAPSLFQHIGKVTTGLSANYVGAGFFNKRIPITQAG